MTTPVTRYRKKPVEVDTIQWTGTNEADVQAFTGGRFRTVAPEDRSEDPDITAEVFDILHATWVGVKTGQHIVQGVKGEHYPIAVDVLAETYEPADTAEPTATPAAALYEQWVKAGAPPLGVSVARWWDARLVEFRAAINARQP